MQISQQLITDGVRLVVTLTQDATPTGVFISPDKDRIEQLDNLLLSQEPSEPAKHLDLVTVTGTTDSKLYAIINTIKLQVIQDPVVIKKVGDHFGNEQQIDDFDVSRFLNRKINIAGTDIVASIELYEKNRKEYTLYADTENPIKYIDFPDGVTTFSFNKVAVNDSLTSPLLNKFIGIIEEPKIESSVFIERGVVNVFESFTKLKKVKSLNEMTKFGFGYYKINKQGFNF